MKWTWKFRCEIFRDKYSSTVWGRVSHYLTVQSLRVRSLWGEAEGVSESRDQPSHNWFGRYSWRVITYLTRNAYKGPPWVTRRVSAQETSVQQQDVPRTDWRVSQGIFSKTLSSGTHETLREWEGRREALKGLSIQDQASSLVLRVIRDCLKSLRKGHLQSWERKHLVKLWEV